MDLEKLRIAFKTQNKDDGRNSNTVSCYNSAASNFNDFLRARNIEINSMPSHVIKDFSSWLASRAFSARSINTWVVGVVKYLAYLREYKLVEFTESSFSRPIPRRIPKELQKTPTDEQVAAYLSKVCLHPEPYRTAMYIIPFCGLRREELCNLTLDRIEHNASQKRYLFRPLGKGIKERVVPLIRIAHDPFQTYLTTWLKDYKRRVNTRFVFPTPDRSKIGPKMLADRVSGISKSLDNASVNPHALRRWYAQYLDSKLHMDVLSIAEILGHDSVDTTRLYLQKDRSLEAISKLQDGQPDIEEQTDNDTEPDAELEDSDGAE